MPTLKEILARKYPVPGLSKLVPVLLSQEECYDCGRDEISFREYHANPAQISFGRVYEVPREMLTLWNRAERMRDELDEALQAELRQVWNSPDRASIERHLS